MKKQNHVIFQFLFLGWLATQSWPAVYVAKYPASLETPCITTINVMKLAYVDGMTKAEETDLNYFKKKPANKVPSIKRKKKLAFK